MSGSALRSEIKPTVREAAVYSEKDIEAMPTEDLLKLYKKSGRQEYKWPLVLRYATLVKRIALQICNVYHSFAEVDDIVNEGLLTLMGAVDKFDMEKGVKFETYVSKRIRGMIIDLARRQDWLPRSVRKRSREIDAAAGELSSALGRFPTDQELAEKLGVSQEKYREDLANASLSNIVSLEGIFEHRGDSGGASLFLPSMETETQPEAGLLDKELRRELVKAIRMLRTNEQMVLSLYYEKEFNMRCIAQAMNISEPRVSQIHGRAIQKLRTHLESYLNGRSKPQGKGE